MIYWRIIDDQLINCYETHKLGFPLEQGFSLDIPRDYDGPIAFTRCCFSIGDWGIISGLPYALKQLYPKSQILIPNTNWIYKVFKHLFDQGWGKTIWSEPWYNPEIILKNNPYIDGLFDIGQIKGEIITDHQRIYFKDEEPLVEQMLRIFGATEQEILSIDSRPQLFFTEEEKELGDKIISFYIKDTKFGTLLLSSSIPSLPYPWNKNIEKGILEELKQYSNLEFFYYCQGDFNKTDFNFIKGINIKKLNIPLRVQLYIKTKAEINIGYQSGVNDSVGTKYTKITSVTPYDNVGSNIGRGIKYYFKDGTTKVY